MTDYLNRDERREFDRHMFRSSLTSLFWRVISARKKRPGGYKLQTLANDVQTGKSVVSRWFSPELPNWRADTISDIAEALDVDLFITAVDRKTGVHFYARGAAPDRTPSGTTSTGSSVTDSQQPSTWADSSIVKMAASA